MVHPEDRIATCTAMKRNRLARYLQTPLGGAMLAALLVGGLWLAAELTGYQGRGRPAGKPKSFAEAWPDVKLFASMIFVATFFVLLGRDMLKAFFTRSRSRHR